MLALLALTGLGFLAQQPQVHPQPKVVVIPVLDLEKQHPRKALMLTQLDRLVAKELKDKGYALISPDAVESAMSENHIDFTNADQRTENNLLKIGSDTRADLVALVVIRAVGAEFEIQDGSAQAHGRQLRCVTWAATRITLSDQKSGHALFADKEVEGHCVWKLRLASDQMPRIAAAVAVGVEDELPSPQGQS